MRPAQAAAMAAMMAALTTPAQGEELAAAPAQTVDEGQLDRFTRAFAAVTALRQEAQEEVAANPEPDDRSRLRDVVQGRMRAAVESRGFAVEDYNATLMAVRDDPGLRRSFEDKLSRLDKEP